MKRVLLMLLLIFNTLLMAENPRAMIVFDASGSMWGQIEGKAKIEIARDTLKNVLVTWNPDVELGLTVYGHRSKGDCNDIETVIPVGKVESDQMISVVNAIQPKGKTPISRSIRKAAEALKFTEEKATIILISDGEETCDPDPCGTAKQLEKEGIDFVAHVIGFNVDEKTDEQLQCIASATGGEYFSAKNASSLNDAMKTIVKKVEAPKVEPKPVVKQLDHTVEITASETEGGKWIKAYHYIYPMIDGKAEGSTVVSGGSSEKEAKTAKIPVGKYIVKSNYNDFKQEKEFEVKPGEVTKVHLVMGQTGEVEITASETEGGKWIKAYHYIYPMIDGKAEGSTVVSGGSSEKEAKTAKIPVGKYIVKSNYNDFKQEKEFEVKPGEVTKVHLVMGQTGEVEITASETEGGKWIKAYHYIYPMIDGKAEGSTVVSGGSSEKEAKTAKIPVGKYIVKSNYNDFKQEKEFEVKPGEVTKVHIIFAPLHLTVEGINKCTMVMHEVISVTGQVVAEAKAPAGRGVDFVLPEGSYTIESTVGSVTQKTKVTIPASQATVDFGGESTKGSAEGVWNTSEGRATLYLDGNNVHGSYATDNGEIIGEMTYPQRLEGYWIEDSSNTKCSEAKNGRYYWGRINWEFDSDMCSFKGKWNYCDDKPSRNWDGTFSMSVPKEPSKKELIKDDNVKADAELNQMANDLEMHTKQ